MKEKTEPIINLTGCRIDPVGEKAETELRNSDTGKRNSKNENPVKEKTFILVSEMTSDLTLKNSHRHFDFRVEPTKKVSASKQGVNTHHNIHGNSQNLLALALRLHLIKEPCLDWRLSGTQKV